MPRKDKWAMPKVSVIIPTFNSAGTIAEAVDSALSQSHLDIEIIVVDDGSSDNTRIVLEQYRSKIKYLFQKNHGVAAARNCGMRLATGDYIAFLDADDVWLPTKIERQTAVLESDPGTGFVYCDNYFVDIRGEIIADYVRKVEFFRGDMLIDLFCSHFLMTPAVMLRKECLEQIGYFDENLRVGEDYDFFLRLAQKYQGEVVKEKLWKRVVRKDSLSRQNYILDAQTDLRTLNKFLNNNPGFYCAHKHRVNSRLSEYYFSFAYRLLEQGHNSMAALNLLESLRYKFSLRALKNLMSCIIPVGLRRLLKGRYA